MDNKEKTRQILKLAKDAKIINPTMVKKKLRIHYYTAKQLLDDMVDAGYLESRFQPKDKYKSRNYVLKGE